MILYGRKRKPYAIYHHVRKIIIGDSVLTFKDIYQEELNDDIRQKLQKLMKGPKYIIINEVGGKLIFSHPEYAIGSITQEDSEMTLEKEIEFFNRSKNVNEYKAEIYRTE